MEISPSTMKMIGFEYEDMMMADYSDNVLQPLGYDIPEISEDTIHTHISESNTLRRPLLGKDNLLVLKCCEETSKKSVE